LANAKNKQDFNVGWGLFLIAFICTIFGLIVGFILGVGYNG
jgi:hypothetical protein